MTPIHAFGIRAQLDARIGATCGPDPRVCHALGRDDREIRVHRAEHQHQGGQVGRIALHLDQPGLHRLPERRVDAAVCSVAAVAETVVE